MNALPSVKVLTEGHVVAAAIVWRTSSKLRLTVIAKVCMVYDAAGGSDLARPPPILVSDQYDAAGDLVAACELAPFVPTPEVMLVGRAPHKRGRARVGFRVERAGRAIVDKHLDVEAGGSLAALGPKPTQWPPGWGGFAEGIVNLETLDGEKFQRAPSDQRLSELRGTDEIVLIGLHPSEPLLRFELMAPTIDGRAESDGHADAVPFILDGVTISPRERCTVLTFRGSVPVRSDKALEDMKVRVRARPDARFVEEPVKEVGSTSLGGMPAGTPLPFVGTAKSPGGPPREPPKPSGTPWAEEPIKSAPPASGAMETLPIDTDDGAAMLEVARAAYAAARDKAAAKAQADKPASPTAAAPPQSEKQASPWREDPPSAPEPPPPPAKNTGSLTTPKRDLNARLYKRGK